MPITMLIPGFEGYSSYDLKLSNFSASKLEMVISLSFGGIHGPLGSLYHFLGAYGPSRLGISLLSTVAEVWNVDGWSLPNARTERQVLLYAFISTVTFSSSSDKAMWTVNRIPCRSFSSKDVWNSI
ncbi:unnamed protein product [Arabidopsis halleri]